MLHLSNVDTSTWRASFSRELMFSSDGFGTGATPWRAVQEAAWNALSVSDGATSPPAGEDASLP